MSQSEARVLIARLLATIAELRDLPEAVPQHIADRVHINNIEDAARELARVHGVTL